jgi:tetraacyldisaccharide 4'-kinase
MKLNKPKFWDTKINFFSIILFPFTLLVSLFIYLKKKITKPIKFNIPIICVGNIYVGGTGKTPTSILLAKELSNLGKNTAILRKYYKDHTDEHNLIKKKFRNLILKKNRVDGIKEAEKNGYDCLVLDDGFQDYKIKKNINILCFNENQLIGNGLVLPSGPLRENLSSVKNAEIVLINGKRNYSFEKMILHFNSKIKIFYSYYSCSNVNQFKNKKILALAGIGNPKNFFQLITKEGLNIEKELIFPDHYQFTKDELQNIVTEAKIKNLDILMTEKDYLRIQHFNFTTINYLEVNLEIREKQKFIKAITKSYNEIN